MANIPQTDANRTVLTKDVLAADNTLYQLHSDDRAPDMQLKRYRAEKRAKQSLQRGGA